MQISIYTWYRREREREGGKEGGRLKNTDALHLVHGVWTEDTKSCYLLQKKPIFGDYIASGWVGALYCRRG